MRTQTCQASKWTGGRVHTCQGVIAPRFALHCIFVLQYCVAVHPIHQHGRPVQVGLLQIGKYIDQLSAPLLAIKMTNTLHHMIWVRTNTCTLLLCAFHVCQKAKIPSKDFRMNLTSFIPLRGLCNDIFSYTNIHLNLHKIHNIIIDDIWEQGSR